MALVATKKSGEWLISIAGEEVNTMFKKVSALFTVLCLSLTSVAMALPITADYAALGTSIETEVTSGLAIFLPIGGVVLAIGLAWRIGKRFVKG